MSTAKNMDVKKSMFFHAEANVFCDVIFLNDFYRISEIALFNY